MTDNEIIINLRSNILIKIGVKKLANLALEIYQSHNNSLSDDLNDFLLNIATMDAGEEFIIPDDKILKTLWKMIDLEKLNYKFLNIKSEYFYSPEESIGYFIEQLKSEPVYLSIIVKECKDKFNFNDFQILCFINSFVHKINNIEYKDIPEKWFLNPIEAEKNIQFKKTNN